MARKSRVVFWAIVVLLFGVRGAFAEDVGTPLFNAFKSFCAETGARADDVKRAVLAAGGAPHDPPTQSVEAPFSMRTTLWDVKAGGLGLVVSAGEAHTSGADAQAMADCVVRSSEVDTASLMALANWAGVPAHPSSTPRLTYYVFEDAGGRHRALSDVHGAEAVGRTWRLSVIRMPGLVTVDLMHALGRQ